MSKLVFEWNGRKAGANVAKHGVTFQEASSVFLDLNGVLIADPDHSQEEDRFILLGMSTQLRLLVVSHCYRSSVESIRIISARKATRSEAVQYQGD